MNSRTWMIPTLPIAAIVCAAATVYGAVVGFTWLNGRADREGSRICEALNVASDKVISYDHWAAAGLPVEPIGERPIHDGFVGFTGGLQSQRHIGGRMPGVVDLEIGSLEDARVRRRTELEREDKDRVKLGEGHEAGSTDPDRSWYAFSSMTREGKGYRDLIGHCFHDGVHVTVKVVDWMDGCWASKEQAEGFLRMMQGVADRLAAVCESDLRPYVELQAAQNKDAR